MFGTGYKRCKRDYSVEEAEVWRNMALGNPSKGVTSLDYAKKHKRTTLSWKECYIKSMDNATRSFNRRILDNLFKYCVIGEGTDICALYS